MVDEYDGRTAQTAMWPPLPLDEWADTYATLHMWTQIVGKVRLARAPMVNHWWQVTLYVTARGLTTGPIPDGQRTFEIDFDLLGHRLILATSTGERRELPLESRAVADFYRDVLAALAALGIDVRIWTRPAEVEQPIPFEQDTLHATYDKEHATRLFTVLVQTDRVLKRARSGFTGKCSPVHFFWGAFDLALTRFSGRRAPQHPGVPNVPDWIVREAYSHECASCGFWPGGGTVKEAAFYAYAYPEPSGFAEFPIRPGQAYYSAEMREFLLPYERVREAADPDRMLLEFFESTYAAAAERGGWDRANLEARRG
ncbi:MAG TPA: DUF5996 family protein [Gammaproteobacteria bacterium]